MNILAIDTATALISVTLSTGEGSRSLEFDAGMRHSEVLLNMIETLISEASLTADMLELVACMRGPGSFTGLRIGFSAAKALALALELPLVSVPTLDCMAAPFSVWPGAVIPVIDAKQRRFFTALYRQGKRISPYLDAEPPAIQETVAGSGVIAGAPILLTGPDAPLLKERFSLSPEWVCVDPAFRRGWSRNLLEIAQEYYMRGTVDAVSAGPLYLRKSDAELKAGKADAIEHLSMWTDTR
ncbi:MAG: tRNA (adenosine(37)-N6)-threonylcarbamoyltransferase complex dimerization subunit type 1 TsaB [Treponema sp.]|jgi:tRNA threonylcarbamoyladenosine biosynthesis protein TsaB|nr:tRNA (adenosine(37)-N6)-threonylcarbamoyltransferase complex dimerization subunit type 1 TsaB [Treponema sp.]